MKSAEVGIVAVNATRVQMSKKLDALDTSLNSPTTLEQAPVFKDLRDEVTSITNALVTIDLDAIKKEITELNATVTGVRADIMKPKMFETIPTFVNIKSELMGLNVTVSDHGSQIQQLMSGAVAGSSSTPLVGSQADVAATIASAVAVATRKPDGESEKAGQVWPD